MISPLLIYMLALDSDVCPAPVSPDSPVTHPVAPLNTYTFPKRPGAGRARQVPHADATEACPQWLPTHGELQRPRRPHQNPKQSSARTIDAESGRRESSPVAQTSPVSPNLANASTTKQSLCPFSVCQAVFFCGTKATHGPQLDQLSTPILQCEYCNYRADQK